MSSRARSWRVVGIGLAVAVAGVLPSFMIGALSVRMGADLGFGAVGLGGAAAAFFAVSALFSVPLGGLAERLGGARSLRVAALGSAACLGGVALLAQSYAALLAVLFVGGAANGLTQPAVNAFLADRVPVNRQGVVFGIKQSAIPGAVLLSGLSLPLVGLTVGWRFAFAGAAAGALAVAAAVPSDRPGAAREAPRPRQGTPVTRATGKRALAPLALASGLAAFAGVSLGAFLVSSAVVAGIEEGRAGLLLALCSAVSLVVRVYGGWLADRRGSEGLVAVAGLLAVGTAGFVLVALGSPVLLVIGALLAFGAGWGHPGLLNYAVVLRSPGAVARATSVTQAGVYVGAGFGPLAFGAIASGLSLGAAWATTAVSVAAAAAIVGSWRRAERRAQNASGSRPFQVPAEP